jgi:uncharacterized YigZ family protein
MEAAGLLIIVMLFSVISPLSSLSISSSILRFRNRKSSSPLSLSLSSSPWMTLEEGSHTSELIVKKSQFLGYAKHVETWREAQEYLEKVRLEHPKARHICFGLMVGSSGDHSSIERCSDDGEPTGTAGPPILSAIQGETLTNTMCIVVRYFGGIKLGAGGLIRAYGGGARKVLREAPKKMVIPRSSLRVTVPSQFLGRMYDSISKTGAVASEEEYDVHGNISVTITVETERESILRDCLRDSTRGEIRFL